jgi:HNH endonuclease
MPHRSSDRVGVLVTCRRTRVIDERGNSYDRRARREWLVKPSSGWGGDGTKVPCWECGAMVTPKTLHVDRIKPGEQGGRYTHDNIRPHCALCSHREGQRRATELRREQAMYGEDDMCKTCGAHFLAEHTPDCPVPAIDRGAW